MNSLFLKPWAVFFVLMLLVCIVPGQAAKPPSPPKPANKDTAAKPAAPLQLGQEYPEFDVPDTFPAPTDKPAGKTEASARAIAKLVLAGGVGSLAALERAALESGFAIYDESGKYKHLPSPESDLGLAISELELAISAELMRRKELIPFVAFKTAFVKNPALKEMNLPSLLVKSLGTHACSTHPGKLFLASFVRALGFESNGLYELVASEVPNFEVSSAQFTWLCLMAAGEVHAGSQKPVEPDELFLRVASGPNVSNPAPQNSQLSMRTSLQIVRTLGQGQISSYIQQSAAAGTDPETALLELSLAQIYRLGISMTGSLSNPPLVRTKVMGQEGGDRELNIQLNFRISERARAQIQRALAAANASHPLPPNGPLSRDYELFGGINGNVRIANNPDWKRQSAPGKYKVLLRGDRQTGSYSNNAVPLETTAEVMLWVEPPVTNTIGYFAVSRKFVIPIRDWRQPGFLVTFYLAASGNGFESDPVSGASVTWSISRSVSGSATLDTEVPAPMMKRQGQNLPLTEVARFTTWLRTPAVPLVRAVSRYRVSDSFVWKIPPDGCLAPTDAPFKEHRMTITSRTPSGPSEEVALSMGNYFCQIDNRANTVSVTIPGDVAVPVRSEQTDSPPEDRVKPVFIDIRFDNTVFQNYSMQLPKFVWEYPLQGGRAVPNLQGYRSHRISLDSRAVYNQFRINAAGDENITVTGEITIYESVRGNSRGPRQAVLDAARKVVTQAVADCLISQKRPVKTKDLASIIRSRFPLVGFGY